MTDDLLNKKNDNEFLKFVFLRAITIHAKDAGLKICSDIKAWEDLEKYGIEIRLTINGVEVPFLGVMRDLEKHFYELIPDICEQVAKKEIELPEETTENQDICGLCGLPGADKHKHPEHWPGEINPEGELVHAECEKKECERAFHVFSYRVGKEGVRNFLRSI